MLKNKVVLALFLLFSSCFLPFSSARTRDFLEGKRLYSPSVAVKFYEIACETAGEDELGDAEIEQAIVFFKAAMALDNRAKYILPDMIKLASRSREHDYSGIIHEMLLAYIDESADLEVARSGISYLLDRLNTRDEKESFLAELLISVDNSGNKVLASEVTTLLGLLKAEKTDRRTAINLFLKAYYDNRYNSLAFDKLTELASDQIMPVMYLGHLRWLLSKNLFDIDAATAFTDYAMQLQLYDVAADAYKYCADLFAYLYPLKELPASIYIPWSVSSYNTHRNQYQCLQIAKTIRQSGRFDILAESLAARAAVKVGDPIQSQQIFDTVEVRIKKLAEEADERLSQISEQQAAWFYCFGCPDAAEALDWANKAYSKEPNSPSAASLLAYALVMNSQFDWAKPVVDNYNGSQISALAEAEIQIDAGQQQSAVETLKSAIDISPGSLEAERAGQLLARLNADYISAIDPDVTLLTLRNNFGYRVRPIFVKPEKMLSVRLNMRGSKFSYGKDFGGTVGITNNYSEALFVSDKAMLTGRIRIDAEVSGDIEEKIPALISIKTRPGNPIEPGQTLFVPVRLVTGELRQILFSHPQANLDIKFTLWLDDAGRGGDRLALAIGPVQTTVRRSGIELTTEFLQNRFGSLPRGKQGQKITSAQLFAGLLIEQIIMADREPLYKFMYADWMPGMLKSALRSNLSDENWIVKVRTMTDMLPLPLDYELINAISANLSDPDWPVRLTALYLLAQNRHSNPGKVLDWTARYDSNELVRQMAIALGGQKPLQKQSEPEPEPEGGTSTTR